MFICLSVTYINSVFRKVKKYYPQVILEECTFVVKEKQMSEYITDDIEVPYADSYREDFDKGISFAENSNEENSNKEN